MIKLLNKLFDKIEFWQTMRKFRKAKKKAIRLNELTGKRWHVLPVAGKNDFMVVDNGYVNTYNRYVKRFSDKIDIEKLLKMAYYSTPVKKTYKVVKKSKSNGSKIESLRTN